ncbi:uncharacterized protein LOC130747697 [Lotus japonicus]|uniref:uncharacterized protein LOC130747697 n=1 Tax=Lotus japonicus TaxID=34305 RepID=UPI0025907602|nr:uncharacterized protein LOC130747697 [Lotus japonicus]
MQSRKHFFPSSLAPLRSIHGTLVRRFGTPTTTQLGIFLNPSQTRSFSSVSPTVVVPSPTPTTFPPPITECYRKQNTEDLLRSTTALPFRHLELGRLPAPTGVASLLGRQGRSSSLCLPRKFSTSRDEEKENEERYGKKFPNSLNWRSITGVKVKDQGFIEPHSNSCAAYSISTILEIYHKLQTGKSAELSVDRIVEENPDGTHLYNVLHFAAQHGFEYTKSPVNSGNGRVLRVKSHKTSFVKPGNRILTLTNPRTIVGDLTLADRTEIAIEPDDD